MKVPPRLLLAALAGIGVVWGMSLPAFSAYDDAYITYRYAVNLARGAGLLYNPGEWVLGTTTPLYALLLTPFGWFGLPAVVAAGHWIAVASWIATAWLVAALLRREGYALGALAAALLVMAQPVLLASLGMETALVCALMLFTAWSWLGGRTPLAVGSAVALLLARQDAALWLLFVGLATWAARSMHLGGNFRLPERWVRSFPWIEAVGTVLLSAVWLVLFWMRYASILPNSAAAKIGQRTAMQVAGEAPFLAAFPGAISGPRPEWAAWGLFILAGIGAVAALWRARSFWYVPGWLLAYLVVFHLLGVVNFTWYYGPPTVALALLAGLGVSWIAGELDGKPPSDGIPARRVLSGVCALVAAGLLLPAMLDLVQIRNSYSVTGKPADYAAAGRWLAENAPPDATVAAIEIGVAGYWSQRPILDLMGLVSPPMRERLTGWTDTVVYGVTTFWPEYALTLPDTAWDPVVAQAWFRAAYRPVQSFGSVTLYERMVDPPHFIDPQGRSDGGGWFLLGGVAFDGCAADCAFPIEIEGGRVLSGWLALRTDPSLPTLETSHQLTLFLVDAATQERYSITTFWPYGDYNLYPTSRWPRDTLGTQRGFRQNVPFRLEVPADLAPGAYRLGLIIYDEARGAALPMDAATGDDTEQFGWLRTGLPPAPEIHEARRVEVNAEWQEGIVLDGLLIPQAPVRAGESLPAVLSLRALHTPYRDLTIFVHVLDGATGSIVAQWDGRPYGQRFPTQVWRPGEEMAVRVEIELPPDLLPGEYSLRVGFYDAEGRALLTDGQDSVLLPSVLHIEELHIEELRVEE